MSSPIACEILVIQTSDIAAKREADRTGWWAHRIASGYFVMQRQFRHGTTLG